MRVGFENPIKIWNLISKESLLPKIKLFQFSTLLLILLIITLKFSFLLSNSKATSSTMKVHPIPKKRTNITITFPRNPNSPAAAASHHKKLRRLPHVFSRVLELPFRSDADVSVLESPDFFRFTAGADSADFRAHAVEIHPGVTKVVVREVTAAAAAALAAGDLRLDELELDMWRFRLPETTRPELASAEFVDGELIVTVPKGGGRDGDGEAYGSFGGGIGGGGGRLVLVQ